MSIRPNRAIVIGAGVAGLLAARSLADYFSDVVVLDRDHLTDDSARRDGVPQQRHAHALLGGGREAVERLLPGFTAEMVERGSRADDFGRAAVLGVGPWRLAETTAGVSMLSGSRLDVEAHLRRRVVELPRSRWRRTSPPPIVIRSSTSALDLVFSPNRRAVTGVRVVTRDGTQPEELSAGLVVDASGRGSRAPEWIERRGYAPPQEDRDRIDLCYTTRRVRLPRDGDRGLSAIVLGAGPGFLRAGIALHEQGQDWVVGLSGYAGQRAPQDWIGYLTYARSLARPELAEFLELAEPTGAPSGYRFVANVRRRYERLRRFPEGLVVLGDAISSFDPAFGQGMSVAAFQAISLRACLADGLDGLAGRFFAAAAHDLDPSWETATARARMVAGAPSAGLRRRLLAAYRTRYLRQATRDEELAAAYYRVVNLAAPASDLEAPRLAMRVLARDLSGRGSHGAPTASARGADLSLTRGGTR